MQNRISSLFGRETRGIPIFASFPLSDLSVLGAKLNSRSLPIHPLNPRYPRLKK